MEHQQITIASRICMGSSKNYLLKFGKIWKMINQIWALDELEKNL